MSADPGVRLVALNGSPSGSSKTHAIVTRAVELAGAGSVIELGSLDAEALLFRRSSSDVTDAIASLERSRLVVFATPIYRATYTGLLKSFLDLLPVHALAEKACVLCAVGGSPHHSLAVDHGLRPLVASLDGWSVPTALYATGEDFDEAGRLGERANGLLDQAINEARRATA